MRQEGFTLIELVMIIVLAGILAVYASSRSSPDFTAVVAANELREALRHVQQHAMDNTGVAAQPGIRIDDDGFALLNINTPSIRWNLEQPAPAFSVSFDPEGTINFNGRGEPTCVGFPAIYNGANCNGRSIPFTVDAGGETVGFTFEPYTGLTH